MRDVLEKPWRILGAGQLHHKLKFWDTMPCTVYDTNLSTVHKPDRLVVRVPGYRTEMYCVSCEVRIEFIYVM
jgi:hypothetical protein